MIFLWIFLGFLVWLGIGVLTVISYFNGRIASKIDWILVAPISLIIGIAEFFKKK